MDQASWFGNKIPARLKLPSQPIPEWNYLLQLEENIFPSSGFPSHLTLRISRAVWRFPRAVPHPFSVEEEEKARKEGEEEEEEEGEESGLASPSVHLTQEQAAIMSGTRDLLCSHC
ncbi:hypothetical protein NXF25_015474 [Crotalus adamanteus]|uniref:Uncharacterized protein n=1 Tax=Crotalus adamanteus TaxID=8729 RepID=A0AAW1AVF3_CROAD